MTLPQAIGLAESKAHRPLTAHAWTIRESSDAYGHKEYTVRRYYEADAFDRGTVAIVGPCHLEDGSAPVRTAYPQLNRREKARDFATPY